MPPKTLMIIKLNLFEAKKNYLKPADYWTIRHSRTRFRDEATWRRSCKRLPLSTTFLTTMKTKVKKLKSESWRPSLEPNRPVSKSRSFQKLRLGNRKLNFLPIWRQNETWLIGSKSLQCQNLKKNHFILFYLKDNFFF